MFDGVDAATLAGSEVTFGVGLAKPGVDLLSVFARSTSKELLRVNKFKLAFEQLLSFDRGRRAPFRMVLCTAGMASTERLLGELRAQTGDFQLIDTTLSWGAGDLSL